MGSYQVRQDCAEHIKEEIQPQRDSATKGMFGIPKEAASTLPRLFVGGLPPDTTNLEMYQIFSAFGPIAPRGVT